MAVENRTINLVPWTGVEIPMATPPTRIFPRYTDLNDWQDKGTRAMLLDQTAAFSGWKGALYVYGQYSVNNGQHYEIEVLNPHNTGVPEAYVMKERILLTFAWVEDNANELPKGTNYDPNTFPVATPNPVQKLWHTGDGATAGTPPTGTYWDVFGGVIYLYTKNTDSRKFVIGNESGATIHMALSTWIWEYD
jgi:hypothetical protein